MPGTAEDDDEAQDDLLANLAEHLGDGELWR